MRCIFAAILIILRLKTFVLQEIPKGKWFCCPDCHRVHSALQKLVVHGGQKLPDSLLNVVRKKHNEKGTEFGANLDIKWRVLNGKTSTDDESLQLLSKALAIFHVSKLVICFPVKNICYFNYSNQPSCSKSNFNLFSYIGENVVLYLVMLIGDLTCHDVPCFQAFVYTVHNWASVSDVTR